MEQPVKKANPPRKFKIRKAAPKKGRKSRKGRGKKKEPVVVTGELLGTFPLFERLDDALRERLASRVTHVELERGELLFEGAPTPDNDDSPVFVLVHGDVNVRRQRVGETAAGEGKAHIVNYLSVGDAYVQKLFCDDQTETIQLEAMCPVKALRLQYRDVNYLLRKNEAFRDTFSERIREITDRQAGRFDDAFQAEIARFLVEQRLTFAGRVKIKRMDICIECDGCYDACKSRHGTDRLGASEVRYGLTEIPQNCHNCVVPECIDKCKFGHISRHPETGEIVIADDCTGCTMCARGCSFDAIRMHSLADLDVEKYFPERSPDAKGKNIAQKCDNCTGYDDMACISACPTGALFQVDGVELFDHWEQFNVHKSPGFDAVASPEGTERGGRWFWPLFTLLNTLVLAFECLGRWFWPDLTFGALFHQLGWTKTGIDPDTPFKAGDYFSHGIGYVGGVFLVGTQLYRVGKAFAPKLGSVQAWMDAHIWLGVLGGVYGFFHTALAFHDTIAVATFVTMMVAILTGVVGRYLLYLVPRSQAGDQLALRELSDEIRQLEAEIESKFVDRGRGATMMTRLEAHDGGDLDGEQAMLTGLVRLVGDDRKQRKAIDDLADEIDDNVGEGQAPEVVQLLKEKARLERSVRRHAFLAKILKRYRVVHVVSSNIMFGALALHIVFSLMYQVG